MGCAEGLDPDLSASCYSSLQGDTEGSGGGPQLRGGGLAIKQGFAIRFLEIVFSQIQECLKHVLLQGFANMILQPFASFRTFLQCGFTVFRYILQGFAIYSLAKVCKDLPIDFARTRKCKNHGF